MKYSRNQLNLIESAYALVVVKTPQLRDAVLIREETTDGIDAPLTTHRIFKSTEGRYYLFICTAGDAGYLENLSRERAANALRSSPENYKREFLS